MSLNISFMPPQRRRHLWEQRCQRPQNHKLHIYCILPLPVHTGGERRGRPARQHSLRPPSQPGRMIQSHLSCRKLLNSGKNTQEHTLKLKLRRSTAHLLTSIIHVFIYKNMDLFIYMCVYIKYKVAGEGAQAENERNMEAFSTFPPSFFAMFPAEQ